MYGPAETLRWNEDVREFIWAQCKEASEAFQRRHDLQAPQALGVSTRHRATRLTDRLATPSQGIGNWTYLDCCRAWL